LTAGRHGRQINKAAATQLARNKSLSQTRQNLGPTQTLKLTPDPQLNMNASQEISMESRYPVPYMDPSSLAGGFQTGDADHGQPKLDATHQPELTRAAG